MEMELPDKNIPTRALVVSEAGAPFVLQDVTLDEVRENEVLIEMKYTGLCHTVSHIIILWPDKTHLLTI